MKAIADNLRDVSRVIRRRRIKRSERVGAAKRCGELSWRMHSADDWFPRTPRQSQRPYCWRGSAKNARLPRGRAAAGLRRREFRRVQHEYRRHATPRCETLELL